jgi:hypothetical protein
VERPRTISGKPAKKRHFNMKPKRSKAPTTLPQDSPSAGNLQRKLDAQTRQLNEALERENATAEVLRIISTSPGELNPVFQAILANATSLCEAKFANLFLCEGDAFRVVAMHNAPAVYAEERLRQPLRQGLDSGLSRCARTKQTVQIPDLLADPAAARCSPNLLRPGQSSQLRC